MFHFKSNIATSLTLAALLVTRTAFADSDGSTSFMSISGGRISAEVNKEREEVIKLRNSVSNPVAGKEKSQLCQGCHGEFGISPN